MHFGHLPAVHVKGLSCGFWLPLAHLDLVTLDCDKNDFAVILQILGSVYFCHYCHYYMVSQVDFYTVKYSLRMNLGYIMSINVWDVS